MNWDEESEYDDEFTTIERKNNIRSKREFKKTYNGQRTKKNNQRNENTNKIDQLSDY